MEQDNLLILDGDWGGGGVGGVNSILLSHHTNI